ncbi:hypothetical protein ES703_124257 [subsurface metagenome]
MNRCKEFARPNIYPEIMYCKPVSTDQNFEDILPDEVDISLNRAQNNAAGIPICDFTFEKGKDHLANLAHDLTSHN